MACLTKAADKHSSIFLISLSQHITYLSHYIWRGRSESQRIWQKKFAKSRTKIRDTGVGRRNRNARLDEGKFSFQFSQFPWCSWVSFSLYIYFPPFPFTSPVLFTIMIYDRSNIFGSIRWMIFSCLFVRTVIRWIDDYTLNMVPLLRNRNVVENYAQQRYGNKLR